MDLRPLLRAHSYLRVQQPPSLWEVECDDQALVRVGAGDWTPAVSWPGDGDSTVVLVSPDLDAAARVLDVPWAYTPARPAPVDPSP